MPIVGNDNSAKQRLSERRGRIEGLLKKAADGAQPTLGESVASKISSPYAPQAGAQIAESSRQSRMAPNLQQAEIEMKLYEVMKEGAAMGDANSKAVSDVIARYSGGDPAKEMEMFQHFATSPEDITAENAGSIGTRFAAERGWKTKEYREEQRDERKVAIDEGKYGLDQRDQSRKERETASKLAKEAAEIEQINMKNERMSKGQISPDDLFSGETSMRKEFNLLTKPHRTVFENYQTLEAQPKTIAEGANGPSDMALLFSYIKMIDPTSTVHRGEKAEADDAGNVPESVIGFYNKAVDGTGLPDSVRAQYLAAAKDIFNSRASEYQKQSAFYTNAATDYGFSPDRIIDPVEKIAVGTKNGWGPITKVGK